MSQKENKQDLEFLCLLHHDSTLHCTQVDFIIQCCPMQSSLTGTSLSFSLTIFQDSFCLSLQLQVLHFQVCFIYIYQGICLHSTCRELLCTMYLFSVWRYILHAHIYLNTDDVETGIIRSSKSRRARAAMSQLFSRWYFM